jgi:hypothetical protein
LPGSLPNPMKGGAPHSAQQMIQAGFMLRRRHILISHGSCSFSAAAA